MRTGRRSFIGAIAAAGITAAMSTGALARRGRPALTDVASARRPAVRLNPPQPASRWIGTTLATTALGTPIERWSWHPPDATVHVAVIAGIHGNEPITRPLATAMRVARRPDRLALTILPSANPDGWSAGTRENGRGVDLNRNFPWLWGRDNAGEAPGSEAETQAIMALIVDERPDLVVWIHQPLGYVGPLPGCPEHFAQLWADAAGVRVRRGIRHRGGGETWAAEVARVRSMLVEVTSWGTDPQLVADHVRGVEALLPAVAAAR